LYQARGSVAGVGVPLWVGAQVLASRRSRRFPEVLWTPTCSPDRLHREGVRQSPRRFPEVPPDRLAIRFQFLTDPVDQRRIQPVWIERFGMLTDATRVGPGLRVNTRARRGCAGCYGPGASATRQRFRRPSLRRTCTSA